MPSREQERRDLESTDPQPGSSTFDRAWEAANGARVFSIDERAKAMPRELRDRQVAVRAGDTVTANYLIHAAFLIEEMRAEIKMLRTELRGYTGDGHTVVEPFVPEAL